MKDLQRLLEIAESLGCKAEAAELSAIQKRQNQPTADIILPLVGEFSSGKTTLINALTDSKALETATKPTTATIYEIHFGAEECKAVVTDKEGNSKEVALAELKNDKLADAYVVGLWDTSKKVPSSTVLVDTPGLSSPDPRHRQTLMDFMPHADGIILIVDVNAQLTNTLVSFVKDMKLTARPIYLVGTHIDNVVDVESTRALWSNNCEIPIENVAFTSATKGDVNGIIDILNSVQSRKGEIIRKVDEERQANVASRLVAHIDELLAAAKEDKGIDEQIRNQASDLRKLQHSINRLIDDASGDVEDAARETERKFESEVSSRLNAIVASKSPNFDADACAAVNNMATLFLSQFRSNVGAIIRNVAQREVGKDGEIALASAREIDLSSIDSATISYNINLNKEGHEYDGVIATGLKVAAAAAVVATAGALAPAAGVAAAGSAIGSSALVEVAEVGIMAHQANRLRKLEQGVRIVESADRTIQQQVGSEKGIVDSIASYISENIFGMGKPQRQRAVSNYIDGSLMPEFRSHLNSQKNMVVNAISQLAQQEASAHVQQKSEALEQLKRQKESDKAAFESHINELKSLKNEIVSA